MSDLEDRLKTWFEGEVNRAERDLSTSRVGMAPVRRGPIPGSALAGLLVALVVVALAFRPSVTPDSGKGPHRSPQSSADPSGRLIAFGADGMPTLLEGESVLRVKDAEGALLASGRPLLVAGWYAPSYQRCAFIGAVHPLLQSCGNGWLVPTMDGKAGVGLELEESPAAIGKGPVVLRLHTRDPRAATCEPSQRARCEAAIVADEVAWPPAYWNGIPRTIAGEPVLLVGDALDRLTRSDGSQLLVGGWYSDQPMPCPSLPGAPVTPLVPRCNAAQVSETLEPGGLTISVVREGKDIPRGRVVLRVHTGDPRASSCPETIRDSCEKAIVVDEVVWNDPVAPIAGRFPDGIPTTIGGERVLRGADVPGAPDGSFLLGGWAPGRPWGCGWLVEAVLPTSAPTPVAACALQEGLIADSPSSAAIWTTGSFVPGPVIVRVHRGADCSGRLGCGLRPELVAERVLWAGDQLTNTAPLTLEAVATALYAHHDAVGAGEDIGVEAVEVDRTCLGPLPAVIWRTTGTARIGWILVYASVAAREEAERQPLFGCNGADALILVAPSAVAENVVVYTQLEKSTTDADRRRLADAIESWLQEILQ